MTIDERLEKTTAEMNALQQQAESIERQILNLQQQRENLVAMYRRAEGALGVLQAIKNDESAAEKDEGS